jgi:hypothetical protein
VKIARNIPLEANEQVAFALLNAETLEGKRIFIAEATNNVLKPLQGRYPEIYSFRDHVEIIVPSHYWRRWARRLQDFGFTREDARVLGLATFGTDVDGTFLGVSEFLTFDKPLATLFQIEQNNIHDKLEVMKQDLDPPYNEAELPKVTLLGKLLDRKK